MASILDHLVGKPVRVVLAPPSSAKVTVEGTLKRVSDLWAEILQQGVPEPLYCNLSMAESIRGTTSMGSGSSTPRPKL